MKFDYNDIGSGPALLFLPGSFSNMAAWKGVQSALSGSYRLITTSLPGYGGTPEIRPDNVNDLSQMFEFVAAVVNRVGEPVHLVGHSYGGLITLAATLSEIVAPLSLITFEGNPIYARPDEGQYPWKQDVVDLGLKFERAYADQDHDAAALIIDFWGQPGFYASMPEPVREYCRQSTFTNILDWRTAPSFHPKISTFSDIDIPYSMVRGELANRCLIDVTNDIVRVIPGADLQVVSGAGHFLISTHPQQCAQIIDAHMAAFARTDTGLKS